MKDCNRCGQCCFIAENKPCKFLVFTSNGKTYCKIYKSRLGRQISFNPPMWCGFRQMIKKNFPNCPYNFDDINQV